MPFTAWKHTEGNRHRDRKNIYNGSVIPVQYPTSWSSKQSSLEPT